MDFIQANENLSDERAKGTAMNKRLEDIICPYIVERRTCYELT